MAGYIGSKSSVTLVDGITKNGGTMTGDLSFGDNDKAIFGASNDLNIRHDPSNGSIIENINSTSTVSFRSNGTVMQFWDTQNGGYYIHMARDGAVSLAYARQTKFATTSSGVDVTGTVTSDGLTVDGQGVFQNGTGSNLLTLKNTDSSISGGEAIQFDWVYGDTANSTSWRQISRYAGSQYQWFSNIDDAGYNLRMNLYEGGDFELYEDTGTTAKFFWDASAESLGIGTSSPTELLTVGNTSTQNTRMQFYAATNGASTIHFGDGTSGADNYRGYLNYGHDTNSMQFATNSTERMRIDSSGNVGIGRTPSYRLDADSNGMSASGRFNRYTDGSLRSLVIFRSSSNGSNVGSISISNSATAYNTSSDYRLKENVVDLTGASARVNQLNPSRFNWIADDTNTLVDGFLAHEVATVVPEAITGTKDAMKDEEYEVTPAVLDDDGNVTTEAVTGTRSVPDYQGIDQSKLVPLLTAALQEALTEIASLKTRVEALEA